MSALFKINGIPFPAPFYGVGTSAMRFVEGMRNNQGVVISQPVGRVIEKIDALEWRNFPAATWEDILQEVKKFYANITYYSSFERGIITRKFYFGDTSEHVLFWQDTTDGLRKPRVYESCKVNLIDVGA